MNCAAGIWNQPDATQFVWEALEQAVEMGQLETEHGTEEVLRGFLSANGRKVYQLHMSKERIRVLAGGKCAVEQLHFGPDQNVVVPFRRGEPLLFSLEWI